MESTFLFSDCDEDDALLNASTEQIFLRGAVISEDCIPVKYFPEKQDQMQRIPDHLSAYLQEAFARE